jgi:hypothetical protein
LDGHCDAAAGALMCRRAMVLSAVAVTTEFGLLEAAVSVDLEAFGGEGHWWWGRCVTGRWLCRR